MFPVFNVALMSVPSPSTSNLSSCWVLDLACSTNLIAHRRDFMYFLPSTTPSTVGGVGVAKEDSGSARVRIPLHSDYTIYKDIFCPLYTRPHYSAIAGHYPATQRQPDACTLRV
jgi:hypothetical protein